MVWAQPGSGKSFLVKQVARSIGANFTEINVAATTSFEDLKAQLEALHSDDEDLQRSTGVTDFAKYQSVPGAELIPDFFV